MGLSIRAFATPSAPALRASGQLWCSTLAAVRSTASRWDLGHRRYLLRRSNHESFVDLTRESALLYCADLPRLTLDHPSWGLD